MSEQGGIVRLLKYTAVVCFVVAAVGLVIFIWGSVSPSWYKALGRGIGYRPTGLGLLVAGFCGGLIFMGHAEMIRSLRRIAQGRG